MRKNVIHFEPDQTFDVHVNETSIYIIIFYFIHIPSFLFTEKYCRENTFVNFNSYYRVLLKSK